MEAPDQRNALASRGALGAGNTREGVWPSPGKNREQKKFSQLTCCWQAPGGKGAPGAAGMLVGGLDRTAFSSEPQIRKSTDASFLFFFFFSHLPGPCQ